MSFVIYGPALSTYVRTVRLAMAEKGAPYDLVEIDILKGQNKQPEYLARHPFGFVPAVDHNGWALYETSAIIRYVDRAVAGPALTPTDAKAAARMDQIIALIDAYAYPSMITKLVMQRIVAPMLGGTADEAVIQSGVPQIRTCVAELDRLMGDQPFLVGPAISLADLMLAPIFGYFAHTPEWQALLAPHFGLRRWWDAIQTRPSMAATAPKLG